MTGLHVPAHAAASGLWAVTLLRLSRLAVQFGAVLHTVAQAPAVRAPLWRSAGRGALLLLQELHWVLDRLQRIS